MSLVDIWKRYNSSKYHPNFHWNQAKSENTEILLSVLKSAETPKMDVISISNDKNANWTKFEQNPLKIKRFQFFVAETPDSRRTFFKIALRPLRVVQSSLFLHPGVRLVPNFSESIKKLKIEPLWTKLWPLETDVKNFF